MKNLKCLIGSFIVTIIVFFVCVLSAILINKYDLVANIFYGIIVLFILGVIWRILYDSCVGHHKKDE